MGAPGPTWARAGPNGWPEVETQHGNSDTIKSDGEFVLGLCRGDKGCEYNKWREGCLGD